MTTPNGPATSPRAGHLALALLAALTFAAALLPFLGALDGEFVNWDDRMTLVDNAAYRGFGRQQLAWMLTSFHMGHHMPLTWCTYALDHALWGLDPRGFHLTNMVLHGVNAVLVLLLGARLFRRASVLREPARLGAALAAALLFAVHPLRTESVAWITERRDMLSCLFLLATLLAYLRYVECERRRAPWLALTLALFLLSLASKAWGITLPAVLLVLDLLVLRRRDGPRPTSWARLLGEKALLAPFAAASAVLAIAAQKHGQALLDLEAHGLVQRLAQAAWGLVAYPLATLWPARLGPLYALDPLLDWTRPAYLVRMAAVLLAGLALFAARRRLPGTVAAWTTYAILISPVLGLAQSGVQRWADRYSYIACIPLVLLAAAGLAGLAQRLPRQRATIAVATLALVVLLAERAHVQTRVWRDSVSLWTRVVEVEPESFIGHWMLGVSLQEQRRHAEAVPHFERALAQRDDGDPRLDRNNPGVRYRMALSLLELGRQEQAKATLLAIVEQRPDHPPALDLLRTLLRARGEQAQLERIWASALQHDPQLRMAWLGLIDGFFERGANEEALDAARRAVALIEGDAALHARLGYAQLLGERWEAAEKNLRRALELDGSLVTARLHLGDTLAATGRVQEAREAYTAILAVDPEHPGARGRLQGLGEGEAGSGAPDRPPRR